jgi:glycerol-1-phosphate dehydrogenase [NAD(P)+]
MTLTMRLPPRSLHEVDLTSRTITIPRLMEVASNCLADLTPLLKSHSFDLSKVCVGSGSGPSISFADQVVAGLTAADVDVTRATNLEGRLDQAAHAAAMIIEEHVSLIVGVGGGRVIDTVKLAAARTQTDFISIPTTIAHDGISSPVASLIQRQGTRASYAAAMPAGILVDIDVIGSAPPRTLRSGVGDLASNLTAVLDWKLADRAGQDHYDAFSAMIAETAARRVLELSDLEHSDSHEALAQGLLLSGLAMAAAGTSRPCSGAEHLISHALDRILGDDAAMHGEQVALGCLISATAHQSPLLPILRRSFAALNLPTHPSDLNISRNQMVEAVLTAPSARPERYTILSELDSDGDAMSLLIETAFGPAKVQT